MEKTSMSLLKVERRSQDDGGQPQLYIYIASARPGCKEVLSQKQNQQKDRIRIMGARHPPGLQKPHTSLSLRWFSNMAPHCHRTTGLAFSLDFRHLNLILFYFIFISLTLCPRNSTGKKDKLSLFGL